MSGSDPHRLQWATLALTAAGTLSACGAANTPESAAPPSADQTARQPAGPMRPPSEPASAEAAQPTPSPQVETTPQAQSQVPSAATSEPPAATGTPPAASEENAPEKAKTEPTAVVITTMSKGRGVPAPTREAYKEIRGLLEQQQDQNTVTNIDTQRIGLEGEMRMCAEFGDRAKAEYTLEQIRKISADVELIHVAQGPCPTPQGDKKP